MKKGDLVTLRQHTGYRNAVFGILLENAHWGSWEILWSNKKNGTWINFEEEIQLEVINELA